MTLFNVENGWINGGYYLGLYSNIYLCMIPDLSDPWPYLMLGGTFLDIPAAKGCQSLCSYLSSTMCIDFTLIMKKFYEGKI